MSLSSFRPPRCGHKRRAGGAIVLLAAWGLFLLAALAGAVMVRVSAGLDVARRVEMRVEGGARLLAGAAWAASVVAADTNGWDAEVESWAADDARFRRVPVGEDAVSIVRGADSRGQALYGLADEERRVNLNEAPEDLVRHLLELAGEVDASRAREIATCIIEWKDENKNPLKGEAGTARSGRVSSIGLRFGSVQEVALVKGMDEDLWRRIEGHCTVYGGGRVNLNTAGPVVLAALARTAARDSSPEACEALVARIGRFRAAGRVFESMAQAPNELGGFEALGGDEAWIFRRMLNMMTVSSLAFRGRVLVLGGEQEEAVRLAEFVFDRDRGTMEFWHED